MDTYFTNNDELSEVKRLLKEKHLKTSNQAINDYLEAIDESQKAFPFVQQKALLIQLLDNYDTTRKKEVILLDELEKNDRYVSFSLGVLAEDWPGMSNSILGIVHHNKRNVNFMKGLTLKSRDKTLGVVILAFQVNFGNEYDAFMEEKKELVSEIKDASHGSAEKYMLLDDEAVKAEIYNKIRKRIREGNYSPEFLKSIDEDKEALNFVSARSREYLEERSIKDLANLIVSNYMAQRMVRSGELQEVIKIKNFETKTGELTGISFVCREDLFSIENFLKILDHIVPGHIIKHHRSYVTRDGILNYRIEIVDRNQKTIDQKLAKSIETSIDKYITISCTEKVNKLKSVGGFEHYARAIIPFLSEELKRTKLNQVFINVDSKNEFMINIKLVIVSFKGNKARIYNLLSKLSQVPGIEISSSIPPRIHSKIIEINILKLRVNLSEFGSIKDIYNAIKDIVRKIYGDIRDFDEGFRDIYIKILNQLLEKLQNVDASLIREIFFNIDELYKVEISPNLLLEIIRLCADTVNESRELNSDQVLFKHKQIPESNRTVIVISYVNNKRIMSRLSQNLKKVVSYFTKIEWEQRSYLILILSKNNCALDDSFIEDLKLKILPCGILNGKPEYDCSSPSTIAE